MIESAINNIIPFISSLAHKAVTALAFDIGTDFMVSAFGYYFVGSVGKRVSNFNAMKEAPKKVFRGQSLLFTFNKMVQWFLDHSWGIFWASFLAIFLVLLFRYGLTELYQKAKKLTKKLTKKNQTSKS